MDGRDSLIVLLFLVSQVFILQVLRFLLVHALRLLVLPNLPFTIPRFTSPPFSQSAIYKISICTLYRLSFKSVIFKSMIYISMFFESRFYNSRFTSPLSPVQARTVHLSLSSPPSHHRMTSFSSQCLIFPGSFAFCFSCDLYSVA